MLILTLSLVIFVSTSCREEHEHAFSAWETLTAPTCTSFGLQKRDCECGHTEYGTLAALSHTPVTDVAVPATCTAPGKTEGSHCSECGLVITAQCIVAPIGHNIDGGEIQTEALCNLDGTKRFSCTNQGCTYYYDESYTLGTLGADEIFESAAQYTGMIVVLDKYGATINYGAALIIGEDGTIVTTFNTIDNAASIFFYIGDAEYNVTHVLAYSAEKNIAVLKVDATGLPYADVCSAPVSYGEPIYTVGYPEGCGPSVRGGIVSAAEVAVGVASYIQHDAGVIKGYNGGPVINAYGETIGINTAYLSSDAIGLATPSSVIESLDYSNPVTVAEFYKLSFLPEEQIKYWLEYLTENMSYVIKSDNFYYYLAFDEANQCSFVEGYRVDEYGTQIAVRIMLNNSGGVYRYEGAYTNGTVRNDTVGFIDAATFNESTVLTYDTYYGRYWNESELMALYSKTAYDTLGFLSYCLDTYFLDISLETFGFTSVTYENDSSALDMLNAFVIENGELESLTGSYELSDTVQMESDSMTFIISHLIETGETVVKIHYMLANGDIYSACLNLAATENGNRFDFMHYVAGESGYTEYNVAWGYLDASSFTPLSELTCYVFDGMNDYEDALLMNYKTLLNYMMRLLNDSVMPIVSPELSVKDLGFRFYFG